ncbi:uncharacterized protein [Macrobrachium rosenbergii]|uniref:uncharacterized protein n=1 Tax=Macrobrachium rosenbergii TaxID=79674 RepID=UPI0034D3C248
MHYFEVEELAAFNFLSDRNWESNLYELKRDQLFLVAEFLNLGLTTEVKKGHLLFEVVKAARRYKVEEMEKESNKEGEYADVEAAEESLEVGGDSRLEILREQARIKELEIKALELQAEERTKERAHELEVLKLQIVLKQGGGSNPGFAKGVAEEAKFNMFSALKLVPQFSEEDANEFFISFERIAKKLDWPRDMWTTLVQCRLIGKAQRVYNTLNEDLSSDYDSVKSIILKAYDLVPEAYRQKFRNLKKDSGVTYVEFARKKTQFLDEWLKSKEIDGYEKFKELVLAEEFKRHLSREMRVHLEELKIDSLQELAVSSDEYALTHKEEPLRNDNGQRKFLQTKVFDNQSSGRRFADNNNSGRFSSRRRNGSSSENSHSFVNSKFANKDLYEEKGAVSNQVKCYYCNKPGHVKSNCFARRRDLERNVQPIGLVTEEKSGRSRVENEKETK